MVGLGGRACHTERGRSLKQFIRSGTNSSSVKITLRNRGPDAYRHDVYGDTIMVERVINKDGAGSYKIRSKGTYYTFEHYAANFTLLWPATIHDDFTR